MSSKKETKTKSKKHDGNSESLNQKHAQKYQMLRHLTFSGKNCNHINGICFTWFWLISKKLSNHFELMNIFYIVILTWNVSIILSHFKCKWTAIANLAHFSSLARIPDFFALPIPLRSHISFILFSHKLISRMMAFFS